jgi:hypothetical protein
MNPSDGRSSGAGTGPALIRGDPSAIASQAGAKGVLADVLATLLALSAANKAPSSEP